MSHPRSEAAESLLSFFFFQYYSAKFLLKRGIFLYFIWQLFDLRDHVKIKQHVQCCDVFSFLDFLLISVELSLLQF